MFSAWKLCQSSSISGPPTTRNPSEVKTSTISRSTRVKGCNDPGRGRRPGKGKRGHRPWPGRAAGQGDVDPVGGEPRRFRGAAELVATGVERRDEVCSDRVDLRPDVAAVRVRKGAEATLQLSERRLAAEHPHLRGVEVLERCRGDERLAPACVLLIERAKQLGSVHGGRV